MKRDKTSSARGAAQSRPVEGGAAEREERILRRRTRLLAARRSAEPAAAETMEALVFGIGEERCAIPLADLAEVRPMPECAAVPGATRAVLGVANLRGEIRPVVDLGYLLHAGGKQAGATGHVVVLRAQGAEFGVRVDRVEGVRRLRSSDFSASGGAQEGLFRGATGGAEPTIRLIDTEQLVRRAFE